MPIFTKSTRPFLRYEQSTSCLANIMSRAMVTDAATWAILKTPKQNSSPPLPRLGNRSRLEPTTLRANVQRHFQNE